ncbi:tetratricopeptide repeat protein [Chitinophaga barathri]|uniref:type IX secretion system periplasmic lipoprotein PorW/SprE n=1 Tax=Chitinophaga barathri TaxID=1647451 RepID=UPI0013C4F562|nr:tetratricopeptide repeat protein [Chitinophaga barathri]
MKKEDRRPPSEKMAEKPFTVTRRVIQNTVTRYNYYYHAKLRLEKVLAGINSQRQDNYNVYLPFYPFTVEKLNLNSGELDSVIQKASVAVQIHDPRGRWIDDCFLLIGKAYYYKGDWENANNTFQYINTKFAPKKKSEYNTVVGRSEDDRLSISTREKQKDWYSRKFRHKAARNDAFIWQARAFLEQGKHDEAQSLLNILVADPYFPKRLNGQLAELQAWRFYKQGLYAQTIAPLEEAIKKSNSGRAQKARMSFILGQLYAAQGRQDSAMDAFRHVIALKPDATMDFNARVQIAKANVRANGGSLEESIAALQKMLRKERFIPFRDAIYYQMAALCANEQPERAIEFLQKSLKVESANMLQKTLTFKGMADIYYFRKDYAAAQKYYDSTSLIMGPDFEEAKLVNARKEALAEVRDKLRIMHLEDSLQTLASLSPALRDSMLAKQVSAIRAAKAAPEKSKGGASIENSQPKFTTNSGYSSPSFGPAPEAGGDWYFYNTSSKSTGYSEFKRRWGNRALKDNWRRTQSTNLLGSGNNAAVEETAPESDVAAAIASLPADRINTSLLAENLPNTPEKMEESRTRQLEAWYDLGKIYNDKLDDPREAIRTYDSLLDRFPENPRRVEELYSLYIWHNRMNHTQEATRYKQLILTQYAGTNYANILQFGLPKDEDKTKTSAVSAVYEAAYNAYRSGNYDTVFVLRKYADSTFGYNSLQAKFDLLEAMTIVKTSSEDSAKAAIAGIIAKYPGDGPILAQAKAIQDVLDRRQQITDYLGKLEISRDSSTAARVDENISIRYPWQTPKPNLPDSTAAASTAVTPVVTGVDSVAVAAAPPPPPPPPVTPYTLGDEKAAIPHFVVMYFNRVSKVLVDEAVAQFSRYNAEQHPADKLETSSFVLTPTEIMVIVRLFPDEGKALNYFDEVVKQAPTAIIPRIKPTEYKFFIISRENFILLNNTKDIEGYKKFFGNNFITE